MPALLGRQLQQERLGVRQPGPAGLSRRRRSPILDPGLSRPPGGVL